MRRLGATWLLASGAALAQCPICKRALVHSAEGARLARGFNAGILFLLIVPFLLFGIIAFLVHKAQRQNAFLAERAERIIERDPQPVAVPPADSTTTIDPDFARDVAGVGPG